MRYMLTAAFAALLVAPSFAATTSTESVTLTVAGYAYVSIDALTDDTLNLNWSTVPTQSDSLTGTVDSGTNLAAGEDVTLTLTGLPSGIAAVTTDALYGASTVNAITAIFDADNVAEHAVAYEEFDDVFTVKAKLTSGDWFNLKPGTTAMTLTATIAP